MKVGTIKKMIMLAEGFAYNRDLEAFYIAGSTWAHFKYIRQWEFYPILLYRAVDGWNIEHNTNTLEVDSDCVYCPELINTGVFCSEYTKTKYLTSQEQAIEACLIELMEGK